MVMMRDVERGWLPIHFDQGMGARRAQFTDRRSWFSRLATHVAGQYTLPLLARDSNPADITNSQTDHAALAEVWDETNSTWRMALVKGGRCYQATAAAWTDETPGGLAANTKGYQIFLPDNPVPGALDDIFWACGMEQRAQQSDDFGVSDAWADVETAGGGTYAYAWCFWNQYDEAGARTYPCFWGYQVTGAGAPTARADMKELRWMGATWPQIGNGLLMIRPQGTRDPFLLGQSTSYYTVLATGNCLYTLRTPNISSATGVELRRSELPFEVGGGCYYPPGDEFVIHDGKAFIGLWRWDRPLRDISPWREQGCPYDMAGAFKAVCVIDEDVAALYELDSGGSLILWYDAQTRHWHTLSHLLFGGHVGGNHGMVLSTECISGTRRLWVVTADGSNDAWVWYIDIPAYGNNPLMGTANYTARYAKDETVTATTISFGDGTGSGANDEILDSGNGLGSFSVGEVVEVSGSTSNDGIYTVLAVAAGALEVPAGSLTTEAAGDTVTVKNSPDDQGGWLPLYTPFYPLIQAGEFLAELRRIGSLSEVSSTNQIKIAYRPGPDLTAEESADWGDGTVTRANEEITLNELAKSGEFPEFPHVDEVQFRIRFDRGTSNTSTPILYNLYVGIKEWERRTGEMARTP